MWTHWTQVNSLSLSLSLSHFRTIESLFEELVEQELLKKADNVKLKDYLGIYNLFIILLEIYIFWKKKEAR